MYTATLPDPSIRTKTFEEYLSRVCVPLENVQKEAATRLQEAIGSYDTTTSILEEDIESNKAEILTHAGIFRELRKAIEEQSATIRTVQYVHKEDSARIHTVEASLSDLKNGNGDLVAECKAAAAAVAERIQIGDTP